MEPVILLAAFIGTNIWGIFGPVPFTNINPTRTFLNRFLGSVQVTSTIWALQETHPKVFPEVLLEGPRRETIGPPQASSFITPKTQEVFRSVTDFVNMMTTQSAEGPESVAQSTSLLLVPRESARPKNEFVFPLRFGGVSGYMAVIYVVISVLVLSVLVWNVQRRARRGPKKIELDAAVLTQLVGALKEDFKYRIPGQDDEDVNAITRRANIAGILDMIEIPPATHLENNPPTIGALVDVSQRVTRLEELLKMIFPYTAPDAEDVSGNAPSGTEAGASLETSEKDAGQERMAARRAKFHQTMREIDEGIRDYNRIAAELEMIKIAMKGEAAKQEWAAKDIKELRDELGRLYAAMVCITEDGVDNRLVLSEEEKTDSHRYTDVKVQRSNVVWQAKYTELANRLDEQNKRMESSMLSDLPLIKKRQSDGFMFLHKKIEDFRVMPSKRLFRREELVTLMENILTRNPTIQGLIQRANATKRAIGMEGERIKELKSKIDNAGFATAFLTAENAKVWEVLGTAAESSRGAKGDNNEGSHASKSPEASQPANPAVESNAPSQPTTPSKTKKGKKSRSPNLYDAETDPESDESEENDEDDDPQAESIAQLPSADEGPRCDVVGGSIDEEVLAAKREFMGLDGLRPGKPQDKGQTSTAPQTSTSLQMPRPSRRRFDPSAYGLKKHMEKISPQTPATPFWKKPPKPKEKSPVQNGLWPVGPEGTKPPSLPLDSSKFGPKKPSENIPTYPPAGTKKDYQPETPKTQGPDQKKGLQGRGQNMSRGGNIGQHPPPRQSATAEERKKLQGWNTFAQTALLKEMEEEKKILAEAKNDTNQKTVAWTANEIWKPKNAHTEETAAEAGGAGRRRSEPNLGRGLEGRAQTEAEVEGPGLEASVHATPGAIVRRADGKETSVPPRRNSAGQ